ncbi:hypothetical protein [Deinococcus planocerae]|uniref:hypothetical protein n=1 Tax=Deinococcus planocerae TaxID=1737569 RepID=UPI0015E0F835|nr:hypothetical protein [Deinococcus planocerae]
MGATSEFRRDLQSIRLYYLSTLESYHSSIIGHRNSDKDIVKITTTPSKGTKLVYVDHNYYIFKEDHIRNLESNQSKLRLSTAVSLMSALEKYLKSVLMVVFRSVPKLFSNIKSSQEMDFGTIIRFGNYSNLTSHYLEKEVRKIGERSLKENADYFKKHLDIDLQTLGVRWERVLQTSKYRNAIIHSDAKIKFMDGKTSTISIDHWGLLQTIDDLYALSVYIGKRVREIITEHSKSTKHGIAPKSIVLLSIDSQYFDLEAAKKAMQKGA